ncbi:hypothetical protein B7P43_G03911, partial [Cryptotermes secundus]
IQSIPSHPISLRSILILFTNLRFGLPSGLFPFGFPTNIYTHSSSPHPCYVQTGSGVHPASYPMGTDSSFPGVNRPGRETHHSPPASAEVKNIWIYTFTPPYACMM